VFSYKVLANHPQFQKIKIRENNKEPLNPVNYMSILKS